MLPCPFFFESSSMSRYLVTGCAGFIASKTAEFLLADGHEVIGVDNLNEYYDVSLKHHRLDQLRPSGKFIFQPGAKEQFKLTDNLNDMTINFPEACYEQHWYFPSFRSRYGRSIYSSRK